MTPRVSLSVASYWLEACVLLRYNALLEPSAVGSRSALLAWAVAQY